MTRSIPFMVLAAAIGFVLAPFFTPSFTGYDPSQFPVPIVRPAIQPAGYAFSIWGVIYLWLILHAGFGLWKRGDDAAWHPSRLPLLGALVLGCVWLAIAVSAPLTATAAILLMAAFALTSFLTAPTDRDRWLLSAPLGMFAGWLTAAASVSLGVVLAGYGWLSDTGSALTMLGIVLLVGLLVQSRRPRMPIYGATVVWAVIGVIVANWGSNAVVAYSAIAGAIVMAGGTLALTRR